MSTGYARPSQCGIYEIRQIGTENTYVGQSINIRARKHDHLKELRRGNHRTPRLQNAFTKYGEAAFEFRILADGFDPKDQALLTLAEQEFMDKLKACFNTTAAAGTLAGYKHTEENKAKGSAAQKKRFENETPEEKAARIERHRIAALESEALKALGASRRGQTSPFKGCTHTDEAKAEMSEKKKGSTPWMKGKTHTPEVCAAISEKNKGRVSPQKDKPRTDEEKAKQSVAMTGRTWSPEQHINFSVARTGVSIASKGRPWSPARRAAHEKKQSQKDQST